MNLVARQNFGHKAVSNNFVSTWDTTKTSAGSSTSTQVKLPLVNSGTYNFVVQWGDGNSNTITVWNDAALTHTYAASGIYTITITGIIYGWRFNDTGDKLKISSVSSWGQIRFQNDAIFAGCANLNLSTVSDVPLISATALTGTFSGCSKLTSVNRINDWNFSTVLDMYGMFLNCVLFNQNLSFNTSSVTNMSAMFQGCTVFNGTLSFNTGSVTNMFFMFLNCYAFNKPLAFNMINVTNAGYMLYQCYAFNQNIGAWDIRNVTNFGNFMTGKTAANFSTTNLDAIYNGWSTLPSVKPSITITFGSAKYTSAASAGRAILTGAPNNWAITDGGI